MLNEHTMFVPPEVRNTVVGRESAFPTTSAMPAYQGCCAHDHDCEASDCGPAWSLHEHIDHSNVSSSQQLRCAPQRCIP